MLCGSPALGPAHLDHALDLFRSQGPGQPRHDHQDAGWERGRIGPNHDSQHAEDLRLRQTTSPGAHRKPESSGLTLCLVNVPGQSGEGSEPACVTRLCIVASVLCLGRPLHRTSIRDSERRSRRPSTTDTASSRASDASGRPQTRRVGEGRSDAETHS